LKVEGKVIGVVEVLNKMGGQQFNHYHQAMLVELTKWAAIAIHNARLFDERIQAYQRLDAEQQRRIAAESRGAMAAIILDIAHTMNNSIGAVRVWATRVAEAINSTPHASIETFEKEIRQIRKNAQEALGLLSTMTGPLKEAAIAPTDVHGCINAAVMSCWWPDNIHLTTLYGHNIPLVKANAERLEAVFQNLLSNAIQALTPIGGEILIRSHYTDQNTVEIFIADNGPGIPPMLQGQIFDPGVSGKEGNLGLGLWLVETFINQFNGRIGFTSSAAEGTTFTLVLQPINFGISD
jgi:signal transduction histidine kinase